MIYRFLLKLSPSSLKCKSFSWISFGERGTILSSRRQLATHQNTRMSHKETRPTVPLRTVCLNQLILSFLSRLSHFYHKVTVVSPSINSVTISNDGPLPSMTPYKPDFNGWAFFHQEKCFWFKNSILMFYIKGLIHKPKTTSTFSQVFFASVAWVAVAQGPLWSCLALMGTSGPGCQTLQHQGPHTDASWVHQPPPLKKGIPVEVTSSDG